jgi:ADP-heptose:LPS heptosyltransferase
MIDFKKIIERILKERSSPLSDRDKVIFLLEKMFTRNWKSHGGFTKLLYKPIPAQGEDEVKRILVIQLSSIGDIVYSIPALFGIRERFPSAHIALLTGKAQAGIALGVPAINEVFVFPFERFVEKMRSGVDSLEPLIREVEKIILEIRRRKFDHSINLSVTPQSAFVTNLIEAKTLCGLTVDEFGEPVMVGGVWVPYLYYIKCNKEMEDLNRLNLVELHIKAAGVSPNTREPKLFVSSSTRNKCRELLRSFGVEKTDLIIGVVPGAAFQAKRWEAKKFAKLSDILIKKFKAKVILFGGKGEGRLAKNIISLMEEQPINLVGKTTLLELAALLGECNYLISNDTGPMHIAGAMHVPVIAICGPTRYGPQGGGGHFLLQAALSCVNCGGTTTCRLGDCMREIEVEHVLDLLRYKMGELSDFREFEGVNIYWSGEEQPTRIFEYIHINRKDASIDVVSKEILKLISLNLWIMENNKLSFYEPLLTSSEVEAELLRHFRWEEIRNGIEETLKVLTKYQRLFDEKIEKPDLSLQESVVSRILSLFNLIYLRSSKLTPTIEQTLSLLLKKKEACHFMKEFLLRWKDENCNS